VLTDTSGLDPFRDRWFYGWFGVIINLDDNYYTSLLGSLSITKQHRFNNKILPTKNAYRSQTKSSLLSLASPRVILVEYGALTLALHSTIKNPRWVPDGDSKVEFPKRFQEY